MTSERNSAAPAPAFDQIQSGLQFSLFYFDGKGGTDASGKYRLLIEGAKFADRNGFAAVWTPERHFHPFGGMYPNPSVTSAALATVTERVQLRAGSLVAPLHPYARIAEEWAVVDNLSGGRVGISFASGWHANDFALYPARYAARKESMIEAIEQVRHLWKGGQVTVENGNGAPVSIQIYPRPIQQDLPVWVTCSGNPETFELAGRLGVNVLTHLLGQSLEELETKIGIYRQARTDAGHTSPGEVTLMIHTFVGEDVDAVRETIRQPFREYLASSLSLIENQLKSGSTNNAAQSLPWRKAASARNGRATRDLEFNDVDSNDRQSLIDHAFDRYFHTAALFGTPASCLPALDRLRGVGVDEIACLIDFGVETEMALKGLERLLELKQLYDKTRTRAAIEGVLGFNDDLKPEPCGELR